MRQDNQVIVNIFADKIKSAESIFVTHYAGLDESENFELRRKLDACSVEHRVIKNRLFRIISRKAELSAKPEALDGLLKGPSAFSIGGDDSVAVAKVLDTFAKDHKKFFIKGAILDGNVIGPDEVKELASLPSRNEMLAKVVGTVAAPLTGFIGVLSANLRNLVGVLDAIRGKKESNDS
jgi:large subunit ribosomal protein L10